MPQTLLALLALAIASVLVLSQQRITMGARSQMLSDEIELAASGLASDVMEMVGARSFDERSTPQAILALQRVPNAGTEFTPAARIGTGDIGTAGCNLLRPVRTPECDDVDDVASQGWARVDVQLAHGRSLPFEARTEVYYVSDPASVVPVSVPTLHKRVTLTLRSPHLRAKGEDGYITATRVISYDPVKAEKDFEDMFGPLGVRDPTTSGWTPN